MPTTIIINVNIADSPVMIGLSTLCTGVTYDIVSGGTVMTGYDDFNMMVSSSPVIIDIYDPSGNCEMPYYIYGKLYEQGEECSPFNVYITDECIIPPIPNVTYTCVSGLTINNYNPIYTYNIEPNTQLSEGSYILTSVDGSNGCYSAINFNVGDCCPGYVVSATFTCVTGTPNVNELNVIVLDASGNVANTNITNITLLGEGNVECPLPSYVDGNHPNSPTGYTFTNTCSGYFNVGVSITLEEGCILQDVVNIDCLCIDCTENPFTPTDDCCYGGKLWRRGGLGSGCTQSRCGYIDPFPLKTQVEGWTIDTTNPINQGLFSIQFIPSTIADKIRVFQDNILIAESPAVGFWNMTFCETDDVLGFWTNEINNPGSITTPWIYDATGNPGVSGMDAWFPIYNNDCGWTEGAACPHRELGMKERRGAGELFFELEDNGPNSVVIVQIIFSPNRTVCTQDCTPNDCPFCNGLAQNPTGKFKHNLSDSCGSPACPSEYLDVSCSQLLTSEYITQLPLWNYDGTYSIADNTNTGNCIYAIQNGTQSCDSFPSPLPNGHTYNTYPNTEGAYHYLCDASNYPQGAVFNVQSSSGVRWGVRSYTNTTCNPNDCGITYKNFQTSCTPGAPQFIWQYGDAILGTTNSFIIIDTPLGAYLDNKKIGDDSGNYYNILASGSNYIVYLPDLTDITTFTAFYDSANNQSIVPYGTYVFTTYNGINLACNDTQTIETICDCPSITGFTSTTLCVNESTTTTLVFSLGDCTTENIYVHEDTIPDGLVYIIQSSPLKVQFYGTPTVTGTFNVEIDIVDCLDCNVTSSNALTIVNPNCNYSSAIVNPGCGLNNGSITLSNFNDNIIDRFYSCPTASLTWLDGATGTTRTNLAAGTYIMYIDDANGCQVSGSFTLTNVGAPTFSSPNRLIACSATGTTISLLSITGGVSPYTITIDGNTIATGVTAATYTTTGQYVAGNYNVVLTDDNDCSSSDIVVVTQQPNPTVNFIPTHITCSIPIGKIETTFTTNYNSFEVYYSTSAISCGNYDTSGILVYDTDSAVNIATYSDGLAISKVTIPIATSGTYYVCFVDKITNCCTCSSPIVVNGVSAPPAPTISNVTACTNTIITVSGVGECVSGSVIGYYTSPTASALITNNQVVSGVPHFLNSSNLVIGSVATQLPTGTYTYYTACTYGSCLTTFDDFTVTITGAPVIDVTGVTGCAGDYTISATPGFSSYLWKKNGIFQANDTSTLLTNFAGSIGSENNTVYTISVTGITAGGCTSTDTTTVTIYPKPTLSVNSITTCSPGFVNLFTQPAYIVNSGNQNYTYYTATANGYVFEYSLNGGVTWASGSPSVNVTTTSDYPIRVTNPSGCVSTPAVLHITVNANPVMSIAKTVSCTGAVLTASSGFSTYTWNTGAITQSITVTADGTYTVTGTQGICTASASTVVDIPAVPTIGINGVSECQTLPSISENLTIVGSYDYITVSSSNINIVPNITVTGSTIISYNTGVIGTAVITATAHYNNNTCTTTANATVNIFNSSINFTDICYGETLDDALLSSTVPTGTIVILNAAGTGNCNIAGTWDSINCCSNWGLLGGQFFHPTAVLEAGTYVAFTTASGCCRTDVFRVRRFDANIDSHVCNSNGATISVIITHYVAPSPGSETEYDFTFTETSTLSEYSWTVSNTSVSSTSLFTSPGPLPRGNYDYSITVTYNYNSESPGPHSCTITGNVDIECCPIGITCASSIPYYYDVKANGSSTIVSAQSSTVNAYPTGTYYIYDTVAATGVGDYLVTGTFNASPLAVVDVSTLGLVSGTQYDMTFENSKLRSWITFIYAPGGLQNIYRLTLPNWSLYYTTFGPICKVNLYGRDNVCTEIDQYGLEEATCVGGFRTYQFADIWMYPNSEITVDFHIDCPEMVACTGAYAAGIDNTNIINDANPLKMIFIFPC